MGYQREEIGRKFSHKNDTNLKEDMDVICLLLSLLVVICVVVAMAKRHRQGKRKVKRIRDSLRLIDEDDATDDGSEGDEEEGRGSLGARCTGVGSRIGEGSSGGSRNDGDASGGSRAGDATVGNGASVLVRVPKPRSYSQGDYGNVPLNPKPCAIRNNCIDGGRPKRTLLAIVRAHWPVGLFTFAEIIKNKPDWVGRVIREFNVYYTHSPPIAHEHARASLEYYLRNNLRRILSTELTRARTAAEKNGTSLMAQKPTYFNENVWRKFCDYWVSEKFVAKSKAGSANRKCVKTLHSAGATPFPIVHRDMTLRDGHPPDRLTFFRETHTKKKNKSQPTSQGARDIMRRYAKILDQSPVVLTQDGRRVDELEWWIKAVGGIRKNQIIGESRVKASDLLGNSRSSTPRPEDDGAGSSGIGQSLPNVFFMRAVDQTVEAARTNPELFNLTPSQVNLLAQSSLQTDGLSVDHPVSQRMMTELAHVICHVLDDIHKNHEREIEDRSLANPTADPGLGGANGDIDDDDWSNGFDDASDGETDIDTDSDTDLCPT